MKAIPECTGNDPKSAKKLNAAQKFEDQISALLCEQQELRLNVSLSTGI